MPLVGVRLLASPGCNAPGLHPAASTCPSRGGRPWSGCLTSAVLVPGWPRARAAVSIC